MANIDISAVSAEYIGTNDGDNFSRSTGNLSDITVVGLSGADTLALGSAVGSGTGVGGLGLGFSLASSTILMNTGDDIYSFSGQAGSGFARQNSVLVDMGHGEDFALINGLASASGAILKGDRDNDELGFANGAGAGTAFRTLIEGNEGDDSITATWLGANTKNFEIYGGQGDDSISATFSSVSAFAQATAFVSGVFVAGGKGSDVIGTDIIATSENVVVAGNSGSDTLNFTAFASLSGAQLFGGQGDDSISAVVAAAAGAGSAQAITVAGGAGDDLVNVSNIGAAEDWSGVQVLGNSGNDVLTFNVAGGLTAGTANSLLGGSGSDTININVSGALTVLGQSGLVASLGEETTGGLINATVSTGGALNGPVTLQGSTGADTINYLVEAGGSANGVIISAEDGADILNIADRAGTVSLIGTVANGGAGADTITATLGGAANSFVTGGSNIFDGGADNDSIQLDVNVQSGGIVTAASMVGGLGDDTLNVVLRTAAGIASRGNTAGRNFSIAGGSGADVIGLAGATGSVANAELLGGSGADTITGSFTDQGAIALSAGGGLGNDSISFVSQGSGGSFAGSVFAGNSGADTIEVAFSGRRTAAANFGTFVGGTGVDSMTVNLANVGGTSGFVATALGLIGTFDAGLGADTISVLGLTGNATNQLTGGSISLASGDSVVGNFDTYFFQTTAGAGALTGVDVNFSGFANNAFTRISAGANTAGQFIASFTGGKGAPVFVNATAGSIVFRGVSGGSIASGGNLAVRAAAGTTTADIISAVDRVVVGVNRVATFNIQDGSGGAIFGYTFIQGGVNPDSVFRTNGLAERGAATAGINGNTVVFGASAFAVTPGGGGSGGITFNGNAL